MRRLQNYTPENFAHSAATSSKRKRLREHFSCELCRSRKVACDRQRPCENCVKLRCPDDCSYGNGASSRTPEEHAPVQTTAKSSSSSELSTTVTKVARLEGLLEKLAGKVGVDLADLQDGAAASANDLPPPIAEQDLYAKATFSCISRKNDAQFYVGEHNWVFPASLDVGNMRWHRDSKADVDQSRYFWKNKQIFSAQMSKFNEVAAQFSHVRRKTLWDLAGLPDSKAQSEADLLGLLPDRKTCDTMVSRFLLTFNVVFPIVDPQCLRRDAKRFWEQEPPTTPVWLPFYLGVVALGFQLPVTLSEAGVPELHGRRTGKDIVESIFPYVIRVAQRSRRPSIGTFQTMLLIIFHEKLAHDWVDSNDMTNGLLGLLSRMVAAMGLHRDPGNFSGMNQGEADMRRQVFWTYTLLDVEHVLQSGTPCRYREDDNDVEVPCETSEGWTSYMKRVVEIIPTCAEVMRFSHSRRAKLSLHAVQTLTDRLRRVAAYGSHDGLSEETNPEHNVTTAIQRTTYRCLNSKARILLQWPLLEASDAAIKKAAETQIDEACAEMLDNVGMLTAQIARTPVAAQEAWTHFAIALLRCMLCYAASVVILLCRRRMQPAQSGEQEAPRLKRLAHDALEFLSAGTHLSFDAAKQQILYWTQYKTMDERARAQAQGTDELLTANIDLQTYAGRQLVATTKRIIDVHTEQALSAIERARTSPNPQPNILGTPRQTGWGHDAAIADNARDRHAPPLDETEMLDWLFTFDDWSTGQDIFEHLTAPWA